MSLDPHAWGFDEYITTPGNANGVYWTDAYTRNGVSIELDKDVEYHEVLHDFVVDFVQRHREQPFFVYYPIHLIHGGPRSYGGKGVIAYMDKLVGRLIDELDRLRLRDNTVLLFAGDNGSSAGSRPGYSSGTVNGRPIVGHKFRLQEGGVRLPLIAQWRGVSPAGAVYPDLVDFCDFFPTFAELAGVPVPEKIVFNGGRSFAPRLRGLPGAPREWVSMQKDDQWFVREARWKLYNDNRLYDMRDAPYEEILVPVEGQGADAAAARTRLQVLIDRIGALRTDPRHGVGLKRFKE
jgi:arylsulfatase A